METLPVKEIYWKANEEEYFLFKGRRDISDETSFIWVDDSLMVHHPKSNSTYFLRNFFNVSSGGKCEVDLISEEEEPIIVKNGSKVSIYQANKVVFEDTVRCLINDTAILYSVGSDTTYWIYNFSEIEDNLPQVLDDTDNERQVFWVKTEDGLKIINKGEDTTENITTHEVNDDLLVYDRSDHTTYLLKNYENEEVGEFMYAEIAAEEDDLLWYKIDDTHYNVMVHGEVQPDNISADKYGNTVVVKNSLNGKGYILKDFMDVDPYEYFTAEEMSDELYAYYDGSSFRVFKQGSDISGEYRKLHYQDGTLILYNSQAKEHIVTHADYYDDYKPLHDEPIKSQVIAKMWNDDRGKRTMTVIYNGENISDKMNSKNLGNNRVEFYSPNYNIKFNLNLYDARYDFFSGVDI